ncbi:MAG: hypothetical protein IIC00_16490, partial [Planctomycetes bacterium]|nr:hypothetical protein [Planctomycetota bacterium]
MKSLTIHIPLLLAVVLFQVNMLVAEGKVGITKALQLIMSQARNKEPISGISDTHLKTADPQQVLSLLAPYERDESRAVRRLAHLYGVRLAGLQPRPEVRQEVTA